MQAGFLGGGWLIAPFTLVFPCFYRLLGPRVPVGFCPFKLLELGAWLSLPADARHGFSLLMETLTTRGSGGWLRYRCGPRWLTVSFLRSLDASADCYFFVERRHTLVFHWALSAAGGIDGSRPRLPMLCRELRHAYADDGLVV